VGWQRTGMVLATLPVGSSREVMVGARSVLLVRIGETVRAIEPICPHLGGLLADGTLEGTRLGCPDHGAVFDVTDGRVVADPFGVEPPEGAVEPIATYPVRIVDGAIEVDLP